MREELLPVDVIILAWGRIPETCAAIDSALSQTGILPKVYVVDQGTETEDLDILKAFCLTRPSVTLVCNDSNAGVPGGRNQASALGASPYIVALDNDAEFVSEFECVKACQIMEADRSIAALAFRILRYATSEDDKSSWPYPLDMNQNSSTRFVTSRFVGAGHMLRRATFDKLEGYDAKLFFLHEEVDLSYRLINTGEQIVYEPSVQVGHKVSVENRVSWSGKRYYYHVRNTIYMAAKFNLSPLASLLNVLLVLKSGLASGFVAGTLSGALHGLALVPRGLSARFFDARVRLTGDAKARIKQTSPTKNMSALQKLRYRLRKSK